jgi:hypothetical protein
MTIQKQIELENLYSKNQLMPRIKAEFINSKTPDFVGYLDSLDIDKNFGITVLAQMSLHKRCDLPTLVGIMSNDSVTPQEAADLLYQLACADLLDWSPALRLFTVRYEISADVQEELDRFQYPLPFVVEPKEIESNMDRGYYTTKGSVILKNNHHDGDVCLDHLNRCNKVQFSIDQRVVSMVKNQWRNLDKPKQDETKQDFAKRIKAFEKYDRTAHDVMAMLPEKFNLSHRPDKRGRTYSQGYHVNYQGSAWNKAVICFSQKEVCE